MDGLYWLIFLVTAAATTIYVHYWYTRPSGMSKIEKVSYSSRALQHIDFYHTYQGNESEDHEISKGDLVSYLKKRDRALRPHDFKGYVKTYMRAWRERNDIIAYMLGVDWVYEVRKDRITRYVISELGRSELETANGLRGAVEDAALQLRDRVITSTQAKIAVADLLAAAFRVDARTAPPESYQRAEAEGKAKDLEEAAKTRDPSKLDYRLDRIKNLLQIATSAYTFATEILHMIKF